MRLTPSQTLVADGAAAGAGGGGAQQLWNTGCHGAAILRIARKHANRRMQPPSSPEHLVLLTERYVVPVHLVHRSLPGRVSTLLVG